MIPNGRTPLYLSEVFGMHRFEVRANELPDGGWEVVIVADDYPYVYEYEDAARVADRWVNRMHRAGLVVERVADTRRVIPVDASETEDTPEVGETPVEGEGTPENGAQGVSEGGNDTFPRACVEKVLKEASEGRVRAQKADDLAGALWEARVAATGRLADPTTGEDMNTKITCAACTTAIAPKAMHIFMGTTVVCRTCAGTKAAHRLTGCPVDWHDGWDHTTHVTDRDTARVLLARTAWA